MPLDFNTDHYSNNIAGEIIESDVGESQNNHKQYLRILIGLLDHNGDKMVQAAPCYFKDCTATYIHRHQPYLWEDTGTSTWLFKFLDSVNDPKRGNTNTKRLDFNHKDLLGKRYMFEPIETKGGGGKKPDGSGNYDVTHYLVTGPYDKTSDEDESEPLVLATPNGTISLSESGKVMVDPDLTLATYADGKRFTEITPAILELMEIFEPEYVANEIIQKNGFPRLIEKGYLTESEDGVYHASDSVATLVGDAELRGK